MLNEQNCHEVPNLSFYIQSKQMKKKKKKRATLHSKQYTSVLLLEYIL